MDSNTWRFHILVLYCAGYFEAGALALQLALIGEYGQAMTVLASLINPLCVYIYK